MPTQRAKEEIVQTKLEVNEFLRYLVKKKAGLTSGIEKARALAKFSNLKESSEKLLLCQAIIASTETLRIRHLIQETLEEFNLDSVEKLEADLMSVSPLYNSAGSSENECLDYSSDNESLIEYSDSDVSSTSVCSSREESD